MQTISVTIDEIVPRALDDLGPDGRTVRATIPAELPEVLADPALLERIISNVAANALRHGAGTENPIITASAIADRVELRIVDRGPGIPADTRDRIFAPFERLHGFSEYEGTGMGLTIVEKIAEFHSGSVSAHSSTGSGAIFTVILPIHQSSSDDNA